MMYLSELLSCPICYKVFIWEERMTEGDGKSFNSKDVLRLGTSVKALQLISKLLPLAEITVFCQFMSSTYLEHKLTAGFVQVIMNSFSFNFRSGIFTFPLESLGLSLHPFKERERTHNVLKRCKAQVWANADLFQVLLDGVKSLQHFQETFRMNELRNGISGSRLPNEF